jgi:superfamily II DNA helicase RecQ
MGSDKVTMLLTKPKVKKCSLYITFDEGHCISQWGKFQKEYLLMGDLRYLISKDIPFYIASATPPHAVLLDIIDILCLQPVKTEKILCSNDRPDIYLMVQGLTFPANSFKDLSFLISDGYRDGDSPVTKFLIFFDNTKETEAACHYLHLLLPPSDRDQIKYFYSTMTQAYCECKLEAMRDSETWGLCCTDAFGMVSDKKDDTDKL